MSFEFAAPRILFGEGRLREVGALAKDLGARALVVEGGGGRAEAVRTALDANGIASTVLRVSGEPTTAIVTHGVELARSSACDLVIAIGGGSVIDTGKAVAALLTNRGALLDYLEVVGSGQPIARRPAPFIAIPTTAGTGAEVTRNAVLQVEERRVKVSLRSVLMTPTIALVDPELTWTLPPEVTASTGLDALTQCLEPFVTPRATPLTDAIAREGLRRIAPALRRAFHDGADRQARHTMALGSVCGGLALANAKLGAVHGFASPLGGMFPIPHGVACARLLPEIVDVNVRALRARAPESEALARYDEAARILTGRPGARAEDAAAWLRDLVAELRVPALSRYGVSVADVPAVVAQARHASSMQGNPIELTEDELSIALTAAI